MFLSGQHAVADLRFIEAPCLTLTPQTSCMCPSPLPLSLRVPASIIRVLRKAPGALQLQPWQVDDNVSASWQISDLLHHKVEPWARAHRPDLLFVAPSQNVTACALPKPLGAGACAIPSFNHSTARFHHWNTSAWAGRVLRAIQWSVSLEPLAVASKAFGHQQTRHSPGVRGALLPKAWPIAVSVVKKAGAIFSRRRPVLCGSKAGAPTIISPFSPCDFRSAQRRVCTCPEAELGHVFAISMRNSSGGWTVTIA